MWRTEFYRQRDSFGFEIQNRMSVSHKEVWQANCEKKSQSKLCEMSCTKFSYLLCKRTETLISRLTFRCIYLFICVYLWGELSQCSCYWCPGDARSYIRSQDIDYVGWTCLCFQQDEFPGWPHDLERFPHNSPFVRGNKTASNSLTKSKQCRIWIFLYCKPEQILSNSRRHDVHMVSPHRVIVWY